MAKTTAKSVHLFIVILKFSFKTFSEKQLVIFIVSVLESQKVKTQINEPVLKVLDLQKLLFECTH